MFVPICHLISPFPLSPSTLPSVWDFHSFNLRCAAFLHSFFDIRSFLFEIFHIRFNKPSAYSRIHFVRLLVLECDSPSHWQQRRGKGITRGVGPRGPILRLLRSIKKLKILSTLDKCLFYDCAGLHKPSNGYVDRKDNH
jgi:hypothetical protein